MKIGTYHLTPTEESEILSIYEKLKSVFPAIKIDNRKEIIGIGEEGRYFMCYFSLKETTIFVKFKNRTWLNLNDAQSIQNDINLTIELFKNEELKIKSTSNTTKNIVYPSHESCVDTTCVYLDIFFYVFSTIRYRTNMINRRLVCTILITASRF